MAPSLLLGEDHTPPERLAVKAACTLGEDNGAPNGAPRITTVELSVRVRVPELGQASFAHTPSSARPASAGLKQGA